MAISWFGIHGVILALHAIAPTPIQDPIVTDRPDFTESSVAVGKGRIQIESGFTAIRTSGDIELSGPELLLRIGATDRFELRFEAPNRIWAEGSTAAWSTYSIGAKWQIGPFQDGTESAIISDVSLPTEGGGGGSASSVKLCFARALTNDSSISTMFAFECSDLDGPRTETAAWTLSYGRAIGNQSGAFLEFASEFRRGSTPRNVVHMGITNQPKPTAQWDIHGGWDLDRLSSGVFIGVGYSIRF